MITQNILNQNASRNSVAITLRKLLNTVQNTHQQFTDSKVNVTTKMPHFLLQNVRFLYLVMLTDTQLNEISEVCIASILQGQAVLDAPDD